MSDRKTDPKLDKLIAKSTVLKKAYPASPTFASYCVMPDNFSFDVQHDQEKILLFLRQHFVVNVGWLLLTAILLILPLAIAPFSFLRFLPGSFQGIIWLSWYLLTLGYALERFVVWYYNIYIITNERIVDMDFYSLLFKKISEARLDRIEDITSATSGFLESALDFGDVVIQTAAEIPEIEFEKVPHPDQVTKLISELTEKEETPNKAASPAARRGGGK